MISGNSTGMMYQPADGISSVNPLKRPVNSQHDTQDSSTGEFCGRETKGLVANGSGSSLPKLQRCINNGSERVNPRGKIEPMPPVTPKKNHLLSHDKPVTAIELRLDEVSCKDIDALKLGKGTFGTVYKACIPRLGHDWVAVKVYEKGKRKTEDYRRRSGREIDTHIKLDHNNIVKALGYFKSDNFTCLAMEKAQTDLESILSNPDGIRYRSLTSRLKVMNDLRGAVAYLHSMGLIHGDIKPDNILEMPDGKIKLTDLGQCSSIEEPRALSGEEEVACYYLSPEHSGGINKPMSEATDRCALGLVYLSLLVGHSIPFVWLTEKAADHYSKVVQDVFLTTILSDFLQFFNRTDGEQQNYPVPKKTMLIDVYDADQLYEKCIFYKKIESITGKKVLDSVVIPSIQREPEKRPDLTVIEDVLKISIAELTGTTETPRKSLAMRSINF